MRDTSDSRSRSASFAALAVVPFGSVSVTRFPLASLYFNRKVVPRFPGYSMTVPIRGTARVGSFGSWSRNLRGRGEAVSAELAHLHGPSQRRPQGRDFRTPVE